MTNERFPGVEPGVAGTYEFVPDDPLPTVPAGGQVLVSGDHIALYDAEGNLIMQSKGHYERTGLGWGG